MVMLLEETIEFEIEEEEEEEEEDMDEEDDEENLERAAETGDCPKTRGRRSLNPN